MKEHRMNPEIRKCIIASFEAAFSFERLKLKVERLKLA